MKRFIVLALILCLSGCGVVSDLFNSTEDNLSKLSALVSGDMSFLKSNMNELIGTASNSSLSCNDFIDNIDVNVYQTTDDGEMFIREIVADILTNSETNEVCNYKFDIDQLDSGLTTIETVMTNQSKDKKIIQRISDSLEDNKTNVISTITKETTEIADRLVPIILEKYGNQAEKDRLDKFDDAQLKIYIDIVKDTIEETIKTLKNNYAFNDYDVLDLKPISEEFFDLDNERVNVEKYKNSRFTKNDLENIKIACSNDKAGNNYMDMIELEYNMKHHKNDDSYANDIILDVFGDDMLNQNPAAIELIKDAYKNDKKVTFEAMSKAIINSIDFDEAFNEGDIDSEQIPASYEDILMFINQEITHEDGLVHNIFDEYNDLDKTYREKFRNENYSTANDRNGLMTTKGIKAVFGEDHRWRNKTNIKNDDTLTILEVWTLLMMAFDEKIINEEYFDMSKFFYELDILNMDTPFVVDVFIEKNNNDKDLIIVIVDTQNKVERLKAIVEISNQINSKAIEIELTNPEVNGYDKDFKVNINNFETNNYYLKSGEIKIKLFNNNDTLITEHTQKVLDFSDIFQESNVYDDYYSEFDYSELGEIELDIIDTNYIDTIIAENSFENFGNTFSVSTITNLSIVGSGIDSYIPSEWIFKEGEIIQIFLDPNLMKPVLENTYLDQFDIIFKYNIKEVIKPINLNNDIDDINNITSYYDNNYLKQWNKFVYQTDHPDKLKHATRLVAEGYIDGDSMMIELPLLEPNIRNSNNNYYLHYKVCVQHIMLEKTTGRKINKSKLQCFPYFVEPVEYSAP